MSFFRKRVRGYKAAVHVEQFRSRAEGLRDVDPAVFQQILDQANGTEAEASAQRDPVAYVALFMHAAEDEGVFGAE